MADGKMSLIAEPYNSLVKMSGILIVFASSILSGYLDPHSVWQRHQFGWIGLGIGSILVFYGETPFKAAVAVLVSTLVVSVFGLHGLASVLLLLPSLVAMLYLHIKEIKGRKG